MADTADMSAQDCRMGGASVLKYGLPTIDDYDDDVYDSGIEPKPEQRRHVRE